MTTDFWYIITGMAASFLLCVAILLFYIKFKKNIIKQLYKLKTTKIKHQKELLKSVVNAQEEERKRIAVSLHDDIGNRLNILSISINNLEMENRQLKKQLLNQIHETADITRNISHFLYPVNLENLGLILYIEELISAYSNKVNISLNVPANYTAPEKNIEIQLYRIIQEFTTNVVKHSEANNIDIHIKNNSKKLILILSDNGQSFDYDQVKKGMGLKNIESRIKSIKGYYKWKNKIGKGSRLIIKIPHKDECSY